MESVRWGIVGCGAVCEVKSGPALQKAGGSALVAVTRRNLALAEDFAARHGVPRVHRTADDLIADENVSAVYIATPPDSHAELACRVAAAGKPCLVEKPMARTHAECLTMIEAFRRADRPLWVAYYRRALPRFRTVCRLLADGAIGPVTSVHVHLTRALASADTVRDWRFVPEISGGGLLFDLASHAVDLLDHLMGPIRAVSGFSVNTAGAYAPEDVTAAAFQFDSGIVGTGTWNFNASEPHDRLTLVGSAGALSTAVFDDVDVVLSSAGRVQTYEERNPPHVHQPLVQTIADELAGRGRCPSTGVTAARASWVLEQLAG